MTEGMFDLLHIFGLLFIKAKVNSWPPLRMSGNLHCSAPLFYNNTRQQGKLLYLLQTALPPPPLSHIRSEELLSNVPPAAVIQQRPANPPSCSFRTFRAIRPPRSHQNRKAVTTQTPAAP